MKPRYSPEQSARRFWARVDRSSGPHGCWPFRGCTGSDGYGAATFNGVLFGAHRLSFALSIDAIPDGLWVLHKCDNRICVNPLHLFLGTVQDNNADMFSKGRNHSLPRRNQMNQPKLSDDQRQGVVRMSCAGRWTHREIGERFGIRKQSVAKIIAKAMRA